MQYYRLWIYSCNVVLGLTSAIFIIFAAFVVADVRLSLLEGVELYHPTFFYAYGALILQCGVVQTIGCLGAKRLSHKLLSLYWTLLLLLTLGDIGVGLYWVFHLEKVKVNLRPYLSREFIEKYSTDEAFTLRWNKIQSQDRCCGVNGPRDFDKFTSSQLHHSDQSAFNADSHVIVHVESEFLSLPESCCAFPYVTPAVSSSSSGGTGLNKHYSLSHYSTEEERSPHNKLSPGGSVQYTGSGRAYPTGYGESFFHTSDFSGDGGGGGGAGTRRGRTVINFPHKNDEPHQNQNHYVQPGVHFFPQRNTDEAEFINGFHQDDDGIDTDFYDLDYIGDSPNLGKSHEDVVGVPDDDDHIQDNVGANHEPPPGPNQANWSAVEKRDIKSYEPIHAHKVRHELHRKSQPASSLIDSRSIQNLTDRNASVVLATPSGEDDLSSKSIVEVQGLLEILKSSTIHKKNTRKNTNKKGQEQQLLQHIHKTIHNSNQTLNKLFPSIALRFGESWRKHERENRRALFPSSSSSSSSQLAAADSTQVIPTPTQEEKKVCLLCHKQPEGVNYHNSNRKDQRKRYEEDNSNNNKNLKAKTDSLQEKESVHNNRTREDSSKIHDDYTSAEIRDNKIEKTAMTTEPKKKKANLLAKQVRKGTQGIMTRSDDERSEQVLSPNKLSPKLKNKVRRNADQEIQQWGKNYNGIKRMSNTSPGESMQISVSSSSSPGFTFSSFKDGKMEEDNSGKSYFFPVSSSSSSTTYLEANSPSIILPSSSLLKNREDSSWKVNGSDGDNNNGSSSSSGAQRVFVYGDGCGIKLIEWVDHVSGIMFILGFCIIGFVKTCFLVILRTEIREMIEKINMIEPEEVLSPTRTQKSGSLVGDQTRFQVSHPLLQNPHRASTVSAQGIFLPTIKSPDGPCSFGMGLGGAGGGFGGMYNRSNRHYQRRASNIVGGDRSRSHSNETVNMSLLMTSQVESGVVGKGRSNPNLSSSAGAGSGTMGNVEEKDPVSGLSITVPSSTSSSHVCPSSAAFAAARYLRRSSTCSSSTNPTSFPYQFGIDGEPRPGPSSRFYQYFEPVYQPTHLYQQHHHHHYMRNRTHSRNMSCGAILPLTSSYRTNSAAAAASALAFNRSARVNPATLSSATTTTTSIIPGSTGCSFSSNSKDETEMIVSVSLEHIASSDQDEEREEQADEKTTAPEIGEDEREQLRKDWAAATQCLDKVKIAPASKTIDEEDESLGTKLDTFYIDEESSTETNSVGWTGAAGTSAERELQRRNGNNNVDLANILPMSYIGTAV